jgi:hypothetical protein
MGEEPDMQREAAAEPATHAMRFARLVVGAWALVLAVVCVRTLVQPRLHSTYPIFIGAARNWLAGEDLYYKSKVPKGGLDDFRYSPVSAVLLTPLAVFPDNIGGVLWRLLNAAALAGGMLWCCRSLFPQALNRNQRLLLFLLVLPLAAGNFNNGQSNPLVLGLVLCTVAAAAECRWNTAAVCIAVASLLKIYPIGIGLVLVVLYPRQFFSRFTVALCAGLILPFLLQHPDYVRTQYAEWVVCLTGDDRHARPLAGCYRDFQLLCRLYLAQLGPAVYRIVEITAGALVAGLCLAARRADWPRIRLLNFALALGCCWMTVFGPATESATYMLLAPSLSYTLIEAWTGSQGAWMYRLLAANYGVFVIAQMEGCFGGPGMLRPHGVQPLAGLLFAVLLLVIHFRKTQTAQVPVPSRSAEYLEAA